MTKALKIQILRLAAERILTKHNHWCCPAISDAAWEINPQLKANEVTALKALLFTNFLPK